MSGLEEIGTRTWPDRATARAEVFNFIDGRQLSRAVFRVRAIGGW
ncbi:hypothetical protein [Streptomyces graminilatus]|nr:hypothetical protein [Streptomyces graminilatus]